MPMEVQCSQCQGRLLVAQTGVVVACPHCGAHLMIPAPQPAAAAPAPVRPPSIPPQPAPPPPRPAPAPTPPAKAPSPRTDAPDFSSFGNGGGPASPWLPPATGAAPPTPAFAGGFDFASLSHAPAPQPAAAAVTAPAPAAPNPVAPAPAPPAPAPRSPAPRMSPSPAPQFEFVPPAPAGTAAPFEGPQFQIVPPMPSPASETTPASQPQFQSAAAETAMPETAVLETAPAAADAPAAEPAGTPVAVDASAAPTTNGTPELAANAGLPWLTAEATAPAASVESPPAAEPAPAAEAVEATAPPEPVPGDVPEPPSAAEPPVVPVAAPPQNVSPPVAVAPAMPSVAVLPAPPAAPFAATPVAVTPVADAGSRDFGSFTPAWAPAATAMAAPAAASAPAAIAAPAIAAASAPVAPPPAEPQPSSPAGAASGPVITIEPVAQRRGPQVPQMWFVLAISYASALTVMVVYLIYQIRTGGASTNQLESLPDVVPKVSAITGKIMPDLVGQSAPMPPGHTLKLGESRRFGNLVVTPIKVTQEPLEFVRYDDPTKTRSEAMPVLKLWLKFENVSSNQVFMPLGRELVFKRYPGKSGLDHERANNFVARLEDKDGGSVVLHYPHVVEDVWDLKGEDLTRVLKPGESFETYVPSDTMGIDALTGELVWRVHFRKGLNPRSKRGVTTLIEVVFASSDIAGKGRG